MQPGDVGKLTDYQFEHVTTLSNLGIEFETVPGSVQMDFDYCSSKSVSITTKLSGQIAAPGTSFSISDAGATVKFSRGKALLFRSSKCTSKRIEDLNSVGAQIIELYKAEKWKKEQVVVTEAVKAESATIIISNSSDAQIDLLAKGKISLATIDLADVDAKFEILRKSKIATSIIASKNLTPLFRTSGVRKALFKQPEMTLRGEPPRTEAKFGIVDYSDFEE